MNHVGILNLLLKLLTIAVLIGLMLSVTRRRRGEVPSRMPRPRHIAVRIICGVLGTGLLVAVGVGTWCEMLETYAIPVVTPLLNGGGHSFQLISYDWWLLVPAAILLAQVFTRRGLAFAGMLAVCLLYEAALDRAVVAAHASRLADTALPVELRARAAASLSGTAFYRDTARKAVGAVAQDPSTPQPLLDATRVVEMALRTDPSGLWPDQTQPTMGSSTWPRYIRRPIQVEIGSISWPRYSTARSAKLLEKGHISFLMNKPDGFDFVIETPAGKVTTAWRVRKAGSGYGITPVVVNSVVKQSLLYDELMKTIPTHSPIGNQALGNLRIIQTTFEDWPQGQEKAAEAILGKSYQMSFGGGVEGDTNVVLTSRKYYFISQYSAPGKFAYLYQVTLTEDAHGEVVGEIKAIENYDVFRKNIAPQYRDGCDFDKTLALMKAAVAKHFAKTNATE